MSKGVSIRIVSRYLRIMHKHREQGKGYNFRAYWLGENLISRKRDTFDKSV